MRQPCTIIIIIINTSDEAASDAKFGVVELPTINHMSGLLITKKYNLFTRNKLLLFYY